MVSMLHNTLHEQIYRAIRLYMFYGRILNLVGCARYVCVCVRGGGGVMMGARNVRAQFPPCSIPEIVFEIRLPSAVTYIHVEVHSPSYSPIYYMLNS